MDANDRLIPIVEDDQGEGVKDPMTMDDIIHELHKVQAEYDGEILKQLMKNQVIQKPDFKRMQNK